VKLGVMIGPTNWEEPVPDTDSGSFFHFPQHRTIAHFGRFISISHTVSGRFSRNSAKWLTPTRERIHYILGAIRPTHGYGSVWIQIPDHIYLRKLKFIF